MKKKTLIILMIIAMIASMKINNLNEIKAIDTYMDKAGFIYFAQGSDKYINFFKIDETGKVVYKTREEKYKDQYFYEYGDRVVDDLGHSYIIKYTIDMKTYLIYKEEIVKYNRKGKLDKIVCSMDYSQMENKTWEKRILSLRYIDQSIYFANIDYEKNCVNTYRIRLDHHDQLEKIQGFEFSEKIYPHEILTTQDGGFMLLSKLGEIYKIDTSGEKERVYPLDPSKAETIPMGIQLTNDERLYFTEVSNMSYFSIHKGEIKKIYCEEALLNKKNDIYFKDVKHIKLFNESKFVGTFSKNHEQGIIFGKTNEDFRIIKKLKVPLVLYTKTAGIILGILIAVYLVINLFIGIFLRKTNGKIPILFKHIMVVIPIILIFMSVLGNRMDVYFTKVIEDEVDLQLYSIAKEVSKNIDIDSLRNIKSPRDYMSEDYVKVLEQLDINLDDYYNDIKDTYYREFYGDIYLVKNHKIYTGILSGNLQCYYPIEYLYDANYKNLYYKVLDKKDVCIEEGADNSGEWIFALAPIKDEHGSIIGICEIGIGKEMYRSNLKEIYMKLVGLNGAITLVILIMFLSIVYYLLKPLKELKTGAGEIAVGNFSTSVKINTKDEIGDLGKAFNKMSSNIQNYVKKLTRLNEAYYKFVPAQFFELLKKENILEVQLGDQVQEEMTIMFANVRHFYEISNTMNPEENFLFINRVFKTFGPFITENKGIVERYDNAGILSLYQQNAEDAIRAAIAIREKLHLENKIRNKQNEKSLDMGIAIHKGTIMIGIIGQENRMSARAVSENINRTVLLEKLSMKYGVDILVTEAVLQDIDAAQYHYRYIGKLLDEERKKEIKLYDFFDGDVYRIKSKKLQTKKAFEEGIHLYSQQKFYEARKKFIEVIKYNKEDEAAKIYLFLCEKYHKKESLHNWNDAIEII